MKIISGMRWWKLGAIALCLALAACKTELYTALPESEGNQMLALLGSNGIAAEKMVDKAGTVTLKVDQKNFVRAVELMRQNGLPKRKQVSMNDVFPSGQLVTSPAQERAKMVYLKEQQLEGMLVSMDGVISASVSIAQATDDAGKRNGPSSVAVFVKYSPELNLQNRAAEISRLVMDSVPDLTPDRISVVLQAAMVRSVAPPLVAAGPAELLLKWILGNLAIAASAAGCLILMLTFGVTMGIRKLVRRAPV